ncbi:MAG: cyclase family protein [Deltaproteobacteria bacterium]|nr:cyclase family protein [Deltaproteobacteria bacterium]
MKKIIDLSLPLSADATVVPGHPRLTLRPIHTHKVHGRSNTTMKFSIHTGTHVDAPYHFVPGGKTVDQIALERLMGPAVKVDLRVKIRAGRPIAIEDIRTSPGFRERDLRGKIVVLHTGWNRKMFGKPTYYLENPWIATETARWLASKGIRALALDTPQDRVQGPPRPGDFPVHRIFLKKGIPFIEHLANLERVKKRTFTLIALPMKIQGGDGAPTRAVAIVG